MQIGRPRQTVKHTACHIQFASSKVIHFQGTKALMFKLNTLWPEGFDPSPIPRNSPHTLNRGNCEEVIDESDYWKETQIHGSKVFLLDIVDIVAFFKSVTYRHKKVIVIRTETELCEEASKEKTLSHQRNAFINQYHISSRKKFRSYHYQTVKLLSQK